MRAMFVILALFLAGCGPSPYFSVHHEDQVSLCRTQEFCPMDVEWAFDCPGNWDMSQERFDAIYDASNRAYLREFRGESDVVVIAAQKSAKVYVNVTRIDRGHYNLAGYAPATVHVHLRIVDSCGNLLFDGAGVARTPNDIGSQCETEAGRIEAAHGALARQVLRLIEAYK